VINPENLSRPDREYVNVPSSLRQHTHVQLPLPALQEKLEAAQNRIPPMKKFERTLILTESKRALMILTEFKRTLTCSRRERVEARPALLCTKPFFAFCAKGAEPYDDDRDGRCKGFHPS